MAKKNDDFDMEELVEAAFDIEHDDIDEEDGRESDWLLYP